MRAPLRNAHRFAGKRNGNLSAGGGELGLGGAAQRGGTEPLGEFVHAAGGVHHALLTGEVRVAGGADTDLEILRSGPGVIDRAAGAGDGGVVVSGMDVGLYGNGKVSG